MKITDILAMPVTLAAYRYSHLYIVQGEHLLIVRGPDVYQHTLGFIPERFASFGGVVSFAGTGGAIQFAGTAPVQEFTEPGRYTLPMAEPVVDGVPCTGHAIWKGEDIMGMPVQFRGAVTHSPLTGRTYYEPVLGALLEKDQLLTFHRDSGNFAQLNGTIGELLYTDPKDLPDTLIPYSYKMQNLHGAGFDGGYVFTPDSGRSWRKRKLDGWGILTEKGVLTVSQAGGVQVVVGSWGET